MDKASRGSKRSHENPKRRQDKVDPKSGTGQDIPKSEKTSDAMDNASEMEQGLDSKLHHHDTKNHGHGKEKKPLSFAFLVCFWGIFCSYFVYGLLQERIAKQGFDGERFHYFLFLVSIQCVVDAIVAWLAAKYTGEQLSLKPYGVYALLSFSYVGAMVASNTSLAFISYPTQVLGKSAKPIPVLLLGVLIGRKHYPLLKYIIVLFIVVGVALFLYDDNTSLPTDEHTPRLFHILGIGELLVLVSLTLDGVTAALQERLKDHHAIKAMQMMFAVNTYALVYLIIAMLCTGEVFLAISFIQRHPEVFWDLLAFGFASALGQVFIFVTIAKFGPLTCSIFTTTRKFFTILGSVLIFGNQLDPHQWAGVVLVFLGLGLDVFFGKVH